MTERVTTDGCLRCRMEAALRAAAPMSASDMLNEIVASLKLYPNGGGDIRVMAEVERIVREAVPPAKSAEQVRKEFWDREYAAQAMPPAKEVRELKEALRQIPVAVRNLFLNKKELELLAAPPAPSVPPRTALDIAKRACDLIEAHTIPTAEPLEFTHGKFTCKCGTVLEAVNRNALTIVFVQHVVMEALALAAPPPSEQEPSK